MERLGGRKSERERERQRERERGYLTVPPTPGNRLTGEKSSHSLIAMGPGPTPPGGDPDPERTAGKQLCCESWHYTLVPHLSASRTLRTQEELTDTAPGCRER